MLFSTYPLFCFVILKVSNNFSYFNNCKVFEGLVYEDIHLLVTCHLLPLPPNYPSLENSCHPPPPLSSVSLPILLFQIAITQLFAYVECFMTPFLNNEKFRALCTILSRGIPPFAVQTFAPSGKGGGGGKPNVTKK